MLMSQALRPISAAARCMERGNGSDRGERGECDRGEGARLPARIGGLGLEGEREVGGVRAAQRGADRDLAGGRDRGGGGEPRRAHQSACLDNEPSAARAGAGRARQRPMTVGSDGRGVGADYGDWRGRRMDAEESADAKLQVRSLCSCTRERGGAEGGREGMYLVCA